MTVPNKFWWYRWADLASIGFQFSDVVHPGDIFLVLEAARPISALE
jgi:hypothetical protein